MAKKICHRDQCKLNQILEQVEALSDVVDELRMELNYLKKISCKMNQENTCFESVKENNKIDYASPSVLQKVKAYFETIGVSTRIDETCRFAKNSQALKKKEKNQEPIRFSMIYSSLKYFKNKIIKNIQSVQKTQQSPNSTKNEYVTINQQQQEVCLLRKKEEQKPLKCNRRKEGINKYTDISEEFDNSADTSFTSNTSAQADITICSQQKDNKSSHNCNCLESRNVAENNEQVSQLSIINDARSMIYPNRFADELLKNRGAQTFLKNKIRKYKKCSCREQCPYALYKLPCNKYRCSTPEKKVNDKINGLTLECLSFEEKKDFLKFINVDTIRNDGHFTDSSPIEIRMAESSSSSLSVDLEVDVCNDSCDLGEVDEFTERRKARTYIVNRTNMKKDDLIKDFRAENKPSVNTISLWRNISEKKEKIDEMKVLSQKRHIHSEENNQGCKKFGTEDFISNHWSIKNNNKQIQCVIPALTSPIFNRKISVKTSSSNFQQRSIQACRTTDKVISNGFPKIVIPRRMKTNIQTQVDKCSCLNRRQNESLVLDDCTNEINAKEIDDEIEGKKVTRKKNICDICALEMDASSSQLNWPRMKKYNIYPTLQTEDINIHSNGPLNQTYDLANWKNRIMPVRTSCPYYCNHVSRKKLKNCVALSNPSAYYPPSKTLDFDMSNVSCKLYDCFEKLEDIAV